MHTAHKIRVRTIVITLYRDLCIVLKGQVIILAHKADPIKTPIKYQ